MIHGILIAIGISVAWIGLQNLWMHVRPSLNRFQPMLIGYLSSLPILWIALRWIPASAESPWLGSIHAFVFHLLIFLC